MPGTAPAPCVSVRVGVCPRALGPQGQAKQVTGREVCTGWANGGGGGVWSAGLGGASLGRDGQRAGGMPPEPVNEQSPSPGQGAGVAYRGCYDRRGRLARTEDVPLASTVAYGRRADSF